MFADCFTIIIIYVIILGLTINFFSTDYDIGEEEGSVTIELTIREAQIPFTLTLTPTTVDDVLADTRIIATDYLGEAFSTLQAAEKATPGFILTITDTCSVSKLNA